MWPEVLGWLQREPDATAKQLFVKLQQQHPEQFADGQLRTLQRRIREWRQQMARELVFGDFDVDAPTLIPEPVSLTQPNVGPRKEETTATQAT